MICLTTDKSMVNLSRLSQKIWLYRLKILDSNRNNSVVINDVVAQGAKKCGIVSCNLGSGFINKMKELGVDAIIECGQTQNPSVTDILEAIKSVDAKDVFVLPNNPNIFLAAQQGRIWNFW
nr:hypothetical protein [Mycoplasmopsis bovis]